MVDFVLSFAVGGVIDDICYIPMYYVLATKGISSLVVRRTNFILHIA